MKMPIKWHQEGIVLAEEYLAREIDILNRQTRKVARIGADITFAKTQISEAAKRGITEYDQSRFLVPNSPKEKS